MPRKNLGVSEEELFNLLQQGEDYALIRARLKYAEASQIINHYIKKLQRGRIHPGMLPTQATGRWSTTNPPVANIPKAYKTGKHSVIVPDPDEWWFMFDWDAIEAKITAAYTRDKEDLDAFALDHDLHVLTACRSMGLPMPPLSKKSEIASSDACAAWRINVGWTAKVWKPRDLFKTIRYSLQNGIDEKAVLQAQIEFDEETGAPVFNREELLKAGRLFLAAKRHTWGTWKDKVRTEVVSTGKTRTALGRLGRFTGSPDQRLKEAVSLKVSGTVSDMMNICLRDILDFFPEGHLCWNEHDGATIAFPRNLDPTPVILKIIERDWDIEGVSIKSTATWEWIEAPENTGEKG